MVIRRTVMRCKERFFWPKLNDSVIQFIQNCRQCSRGKCDTRRVQAPLQPIEVSEPFVSGLGIIWDHPRNSQWQQTHFGSDGSLHQMV